eukprot:222991-Chlamydomonas_euryale.AAC.1
MPEPRRAHDGFHRIARAVAQHACSRHRRHKAATASQRQKGKQKEGARCCHEGGLPFHKGDLRSGQRRGLSEGLRGSGIERERE